MLKHRIEEQRYQQELADMKFEGSVFSEMRSPLEHSQDLNFISAPQTGPPPPFDGPVTDKSPATRDVKIMLGDADLTSADQAAPYVMQQLQKSGALKTVEGYVELHGNPKGAAILLLRGGKRALLVPHMESESFIRRNSRRVDLIIMVGTDGKGVVVTPLEELVSQNILPG